MYAHSWRRSNYSNGVLTIEELFLAAEQAAEPVDALLLRRKGVFPRAR
jgi:hypothetical protein